MGSEDKPKTRDRLLEMAKSALSEVFGDTSVSRDKTRERLDELSNELDAMIGALDSDDAHVAGQKQD
jgi:hypothetical protein